MLPSYHLLGAWKGRNWARLQNITFYFSETPQIQLYFSGWCTNQNWLIIPKTKKKNIYWTWEAPPPSSYYCILVSISSLTKQIIINFQNMNSFLQIWIYYYFMIYYHIVVQGVKLYRLLAENSYDGFPQLNFIFS